MDDNMALVVEEPQTTAIQEQKSNNVDANQVVNCFNNLISLSNGIVSLVQAEKIAQKELEKMDRELSALALGLKGQQQKREDIKIESKRIHEEIHRFIDLIEDISKKVEKTELDYKLIEVYTTVINNTMTKLPTIS